MKKVNRNAPCPCGSGKKFKRCHLYVQRAGIRYISDRFTASLFERIGSLEPKVRSAWEDAESLIDVEARKVAGTVGPPETVCLAVEGYSRQLESFVAPLIQKHSAVFWLCLDRRLPPGYFEKGDELRGCALSEQSNQVKTLLFHKHGHPDIEPYTALEDGTFDFQVADEDIVNLFGRMGVLFHALAFLPSEYRRVAKGAAVCHDDGHGITTRLTPELEKLVAIYDARRITYHDLFLSTGGLGALRGRELGSKKRKWNVRSASTIAAIPGTGEIEHKIPGLGTVKFPGFSIFELSLEELENLRPFASRFPEVLGMSLDQLVECYIALKRYILTVWSPAAEYTLVSRGIWFTSGTALRGNLRGAHELGSREHRNLVQAADSGGLIDRFMEMLQGDPKNSDLLLRNNLRALSITNTISALDLSILPAALAGFLIDLTIDDEMKRIKGSQFEKHVTQTIEKEIPSARFPIQPGLALRRIGEQNSFAEFDTYAQVEDVLFLIESKAYSVTREYLKGTPKSVHNRWELVQSWLRRADERANQIAATRVGSNYAIPLEVKCLVPVICSAFSEFIWSNSEELFLLKDKTPRVCTPRELCSVLSGSMTDLRTKPYSVRLS